MRRLIRAKAPLRVSFAGGGTDVPPFPATEGGLVLSATINRYAYGALAPRDDGQIGIESLDLGMSVAYAHDDALDYDGDLDLVKAAIRKLGRGGFDLFLHSSAPPGCGLGSSSSMIVTLIGLLKEYHRLALTDYDIAHLAFTVEREDLGIKGGLQDQYAATFGGFNFIEMDGENVLVNPLRVADEVLHELEHNMLLCYTGRTRRSDHIIEDQTSRFVERDQHALDGLRMQKRLAVEMKNALLRRRLNDFGSLLGTAWEFKKKMSPRISNGFIDEAYDAACREGALGGKVTGAGGGGYMLFFCPFHRKHRVAEQLTRMGGQVTEFEFAPRGLTTWTVNDD
ncbi:GHMP kinase [Solirubrobacter sp. CPCC 204708]|uniref:GHMP kinase n=1 Tax=Solirubrobacter deserti TaxID=2282478 RepID=A0ABT4RM45_9ACTN|nr:GHMP kinase [Solirubrobacter deserti]MBE2317963.1 GHMP kinase [Solirubrobacter deserti]MDA0139642.1 GHMP kinase [Solirubrobacter deserti]